MRRTQFTLVVFQTGLALLVLIAAGLLTRTLRELGRLDTGLAADHVTVLQLAWPLDKFDNSPERDRDVRPAPPCQRRTAESRGRCTCEHRTIHEEQPQDGKGASSRAASLRSGARSGPEHGGGRRHLPELGIHVLRGRGFADADR